MSSYLWAETLFPVVWAPMLFHNVVVFDGAHSFPRCTGQQYLPDSSLPQCRHPLCHGTPGHPLCLGAPASNKPHLAEKSTPVWLAIWRTWAGFANSQLLPDAASGAPSRALSAESPAESATFPHRLPLRSIPPAALRLRAPSHSRGAWAPTVCAEEFPTPLERSICQIVSVHWIAAAQTDANLSAHLHRLPTPPPYLRQMRLLPGWGAGVGCWILLSLSRSGGIGWQMI